ncbi:MAG: EscU/YscU/HrcU family type III secretion system export apparatus switch protein [Planctomycetes bacterium]|nr:EscU/YscU/HrcU family type III secretion system export apparatus switch protein [Planctomycetota bacterium]
MSGEKRHDASAQKLRDARKQGNVAFSRDLVAFCTLAVGVGLIASQADQVAGSFTRMWVAAVQAIADPEVDRQAALAVAVTARDELHGLLGGTLLPAWVAVLIVCVLQVGVLFVPAKLAPKVENFDPIRRLGQLFSRRQLGSLVRAFLLTLFASLVLYSLLLDDGAAMLRLRTDDGPEMALPRIAAVAWGVFGSIVVWTLLLCGAHAALDAWSQRRSRLRDLRMSDEDRKQEYKNQEGSPEVRAERRRAHRALAEERMVAAVPEGDVVVVNPTHITCVLRFDPAREPTPRILAVGEGHLAKRLKKAARQARLPIVRNVPLARAVRQLPSDALLPVELEKAAVAVFVWAEEYLQLRGRTPRWRQPVRRAATIGGTDSLNPLDNDSEPAEPARSDIDEEPR